MDFKWYAILLKGITIFVGILNSWIALPTNYIYKVNIFVPLNSEQHWQANDFFSITKHFKLRKKQTFAFRDAIVVNL